MNFEPSKFLRNVEIKVRGRTALLVFGMGFLTLLFWLAMRDYAGHPTFSVVIASVVVAVVFCLLLLGVLGKPRPEEMPAKSAVQVGPFGFFFARGISSQEDLMQVIRQWNAIQKLPPPSALVKGSAARQEDYCELSPVEADKFVEEVEKGVEATLQREAHRLAKELGEKLLSEATKPQIEGKAEAPPE